MCFMLADWCFAVDSARVMNQQILAQAANEARGLAIDAVNVCSSGHLGLPLGCAEVGASLFGESMRYNPDAPKWLNRDRFVLSAGHGSMFIYSWLHLSGYAVSLEDVKSFRKLHSITPGHPEFEETPGVEATTGPLGQGVANAVGARITAVRRTVLFSRRKRKASGARMNDKVFDNVSIHGLTKQSLIAPRVSIRKNKKNFFPFYEIPQRCFSRSTPVFSFFFFILYQMKPINVTRKTEKIAILKVFT